MKTLRFLGCLLLPSLVCQCSSSDSTSGFVTDQRILFSDELHNENTEMILLGDRIVLAFRGGEIRERCLGF